MRISRRLLLLLAAASLAARPAHAQAWFGVPLPPPADTDGPVVITGPRAAAPAAVPDGETGDTHLDGARMMEDVRTIVGFSHWSRESREIGDAQLWGRVTGLESGNRTIAWGAGQLREAGVPEVDLQAFEQDAGSELWLPLRWEVRLLGNDAFGPGSRDVVLQSAMPIGRNGESDQLEAPLVYVGTASPAELEHIDVRGKIAVQKIIPQGHTVFTRDPAGPRAEDLLDRGAVAVLNVLDLPGNVRSFDMGCGDGTCFNLGGRDGLFLERVMNGAAEAGSLGELRMRISLESESLPGLASHNAVGIIPGRTGGAPIVVNAHADAWFDGAGDNADGLAVLLALARHFSEPQNRLDGDVVFVVSAGHHSRGLSGPSHFLAMNPQIAADAKIIINLEHTSQREIAPARSEFPDGYREWVMDSYEAPIVAGVSSASPFLERVIADGIQRYGTNFVSGSNDMASGEGGSYVRAGKQVFTTMQGPPLYHTTGETVEMISEPGLERMARFMAFFIEQVDGAGVSQVAPE